MKKLVYVYLVRYAEEQQDLALLSISTFQRGLKVSGLRYLPRPGPHCALWEEWARAWEEGSGGPFLPALGWEGQSQRKGPARPSRGGSQLGRGMPDEVSAEAVSPLL